MNDERDLFRDAPDTDEPVMDPAAKTQPAEGGREEVEEETRGSAEHEAEPRSRE